MDPGSPNSKFKTERMKKISLFVLLLLMSNFVLSEKKLLLNYEEVVAQAKAELDSSMHAGTLKDFAAKNRIKGNYVMDITIHEKGKVLTVFIVSGNADDINMQRKLKDFMIMFSFSFKMPAGKPYKFQYSFQF